MWVGQLSPKTNLANPEAFLPKSAAGNWECHAFAAAMLSFWEVVM